MRLNHPYLKTMPNLIGAACAVVATCGGPLEAQTWQTVLNYQLAAGQAADANGIVADAAGNVFAGATAADASGTIHGLVLKTATTQGTWNLSDDSNPSPGQEHS